MENPRILSEKIEEQTLSEYATLSKNTKGRAEFVPLCNLRTEFQRDRDRIIHSKSFRRLKHKTQVFLAPEGDHYRTRLTHTLEVAQIARTAARALRLNEDLTEAIALGHDMGHTPFGHSGERALHKLCENGFRHNEQSLRTVDIIDKLNLTAEVRDGILCHTGDKKPSTPEGKIVCLADKIAYINHDIDDAIRAGILKYEAVPKEYADLFGKSQSARINTMLTSLVENSFNGEIRMAEDMFSAMMGLRRFMFENVYFNETALENEKKAFMIIKNLYERYRAEGKTEQESIDYIAGMTDRYAISTFEKFFVPKSWHI
ncbi:MAG: deoxyguanosinetriphosphate triphosphohydrolase [Ruminococcaceae bacterium]|nr:deoxyguanosinetriphosphate triphosphohydrolase [Oscillospiraceae bacterium]